MYLWELTSPEIAGLPRDIVGLMSFGRGSKRADPTKTGQFGLGFNGVYGEGPGVGRGPE